MSHKMLHMPHCLKYASPIHFTRSTVANVRSQSVGKNQLPKNQYAMPSQGLYEWKVVVMAVANMLKKKVLRSCITF